MSRLLHNFTGIAGNFSHHRTFLTTFTPKLQGPLNKI